jgi:hypothetical protein
VWNNHENPKHKIAPIKKAENTAFSCHWISIDGRLIKSPATHTNAIIPVNYNKNVIHQLVVYIKYSGPLSPKATLPIRPDFRSPEIVK